MRRRKLGHWLYPILFFCALVSLAFGDPVPVPGLRPVQVNMPLRRVSLPEHLSEGERAAIFVAGVFPNGCYRAGPTEIAVDESHATLCLRQTAYVVLAYCDETLVPFAQAVSVGPLKAGRYRVLDAVTHGELGWLQVTPRR